MKRDEDYLRELLTEFESSSDFIVLSSLTLGASLEEKKRYYHIELLCDAGLMLPVGETSYRLTSQGHDFLEAVRSESRWSKIKHRAGSVTLPILYDVSVALLKEEVRNRLGGEW
ncbi:DUF2513 domain-containing protein [Pontivivens ytuae]|uniref:DUF2513 domain-containing protein n=1 Tax=Pontivivens ytuae TaxID=2789856 RepID=A0A7S9LPD9_9RHOB|nr:DUF2513 domain-containing protein [Pontivivens ytuae]QPH52809.1 DUF2513 domain-containing protein [Pontivivens ytuae]